MLKFPISFDQKLDFPYLNFYLLYVLFILLHNVEFIDFDIDLRVVKFTKVRAPCGATATAQKIKFSI